jgi:broad specificity phosphatase PhoE
VHRQTLLQEGSSISKKDVSDSGNEYGRPNVARTNEGRQPAAAMRMVSVARMIDNDTMNNPMTISSTMMRCVQFTRPISEHGTGERTPRSVWVEEHHGRVVLIDVEKVYIQYLYL